MTLDEFLAERIRELRISRGESPNRVAAALSMSLDKYGELEAGRNVVRSEVIVDAAVFFNTPVTYFFEGYEIKHTLSAH